MARATLHPIALVAALAAAGCDIGDHSAPAGAGVDAGPLLADGGVVDVGAGAWPPSLAPVAPVPMDDVTVFAFSQVATNASDPQVTQLAPDMNIRAWQRWDLGGVVPSDYDFSYVTACHAQGVRFIGGTTATALFQDEFTDAGELQQILTRDATGAVVNHDTIVPGMRRGSLADPDYRAYLVNIGKIQIDGGVDGLFFDEVNGDYDGAANDGDEGFDDHHLADFNGYLLWRYPGADYATMFGMTPGNLLRADVPSGDLIDNFDYQTYLASNGWSTEPFAAANPLAAVWGRTLPNRPEPSPTTFVDTAEPYRYWQQIVGELRAYAQQTYQRTLFITANGVWPFVDFQSVGLYDGNQDGVGGTEAPYVPVAGGQLDGTVSLQHTFLRLAARSAALAPGAPVVLFLDWPTTYSQSYLAFTPQEQMDYWRLYAAEAYANGLFYAFFLMDTVGDPSATELGLMPFFTSLTAFYRAHAGLYHGVTRGAEAVTTSLSTAMVAVSDQASPHRLLVHLVNHAYSGGIVAQSGVQVTIPSAAAPSGVTLASPDAAADATLPFAYAGGQITVTVPTLDAYAVVVVAY